MIEVDGEKLTQREVDDMLLQACKTTNVAKIVRCVEELGANVNCKDQAGYTSALMYALRACHKKDKDAELMVMYLVNSGADINAKHGTKGSNMDSRASILYYAATNVEDISDKLVRFLVKNSSLEALTYAPSTNHAETHTSALEEIRRKRPELYSKLVKEKVIPSNTNRR